VTTGSLASNVNVTDGAAAVGEADVAVDAAEPAVDGSGTTEGPGDIETLDTVQAGPARLITTSHAMIPAPTRFLAIRLAP
jgi:hypothetical protein